MSGRATDESCISRERGDRVAGAAALALADQATPQGGLARWPAVTGVHGPDTLHKANEEFTEAFRQSKRIIAVANDLLQARESGIAVFEGDVLQQVHDTASGRAGSDDFPIGPAISILLRIMIIEARARVAAGGTTPDFMLVSIYRAGDGPKSPHKGKRALDIGRYAGRILNIANGAAVEAGVTQFYRDLAAHSAEITFDYGFGLPRNLRTGDTEIVSELSGRYGKIHMDIYARALGRNLAVEQCGPKLNDEIRKKYKFVDVFLDHSGTPGHSLTGTVQGDIAKLIWPGLSAAWQQIFQQGGGRLKAIFPDEVDHLHVQALT